MKKILIVEDNEDIKELLVTVLSKSYDVHAVTSAEEAEQLAFSNAFNLIILDLSLPQMSGHELCHTMRSLEQYKKVPIMIISANTSKASHTMAYKLGANIFIDKPFDNDELSAAVKSLLEFCDSPAADLIAGKLNVNVQKNEASIDGRKIEMSYKEIVIISYMVQNLGKVIPRDTILRNCWNDHLELSDRVVDCHMARIRKKISGSRLLIKSEYSIGYVLLEDIDTNCGG